MKVLTSEEMQLADRNTFTSLRIESRVIMENAGRAVVQAILQKFPREVDRGVLVLTGSGNNGGDGYVIARALANLGIAVKVWALKPESGLKGDALANLESWRQQCGAVEDLSQATGLDAKYEQLLVDSGLIVDAVYGTGLRDGISTPLSEIFLQVQKQCERGNVAIVAVDIASGVEASTGRVSGGVLKADMTVALQHLKIGHLVYPGAACAGEVWVADIGIVPSLETDREMLCAQAVVPLVDKFFEHNPEGHKGSKGHVLVVGADAGHFGAVRLSASAALSCGAGLVTMAVPSLVQSLVAPDNFELMCVGLDADPEGQFAATAASDLRALIRGKDAVVLGPGIGKGAGVLAVVREVMSVCAEQNCPLVIDADALNIIAADAGLRKLVPNSSILTPHPGEMSRLLAQPTAEIQSDRLGSVTKLASELNAWVLLKGARSLICGPKGEMRINPAATEALGTAGSGDVLAGVIAAMLARGMSSLEASSAAVYLHGVAGELLEAERGGPQGIKAGDISNCIAWLINHRERFAVSESPILSAVLPGSLPVATLLALLTAFRSSVFAARRQ